MYFREEINESLTLQFAEAARERRAAGQDIISLGLGEPDFGTPQPVIDAVADVLGSGNSMYSSANGIAGLRTLIAEKMVRDNGIPVEPGQIVITAGAKQALSVALMAMLQPHDEVVVISPSFVSFVPQVYLAEPTATVRIVAMEKGSMQLPLAALKEAVGPKTRAILINTPNNPAGFVHSSEELATVLKIAQEADCYVIADEVYEKLVFDSTAHVSAGSLESAVERVITINGFSKSHALTGWRVGYAAIPDSIRPKVIKIQQHMNTNTCTFVQEALTRSWDPDCTHLTDYLRTLSTRVSTVADWVAATPGIQCHLPGAGFFAFVDVSALGKTSNEFCAGLLAETGVATTPGLAFGKDWDDHFRLSFAVPDDTLAKGLTLISEYVAGQQS